MGARPVRRGQTTRPTGYLGSERPIRPVRSGPSGSGNLKPVSIDARGPSWLRKLSADWVARLAWWCWIKGLLIAWVPRFRARRGSARAAYSRGEQSLESRSQGCRALGRAYLAEMQYTGLTFAVDDKAQASTARQFHYLCHFPVLVGPPILAAHKTGRIMIKVRLLRRRSAAFAGVNLRHRQHDLRTAV
jgi:hypothetical protein